MVGGPSGLYAAAEPERIENAGPAPVAPPSAEQERLTRGFHIRMADWLEHGPTPGCQKCNTARDLGWSFAGGPRSKACVERCRGIFGSSEDAFAWSVPHEYWAHAFLRLSSRAPQRLRRSC